MATETLTIDLPRELAEKVRAKVAAGEYASASEVVQDGLGVLWEHEEPLPSGPAWDNWVRDELLPAVEELRADPARGVPLEVVRAELAERHARRLRQG